LGFLYNYCYSFFPATEPKSFSSIQSIECKDGEKRRVSMVAKTFTQNIKPESSLFFILFTLATKSFPSFESRVIRKITYPFLPIFYHFRVVASSTNKRGPSFSNLNFFFRSLKYNGAPNIFFWIMRVAGVYSIKSKIFLKNVFNQLLSYVDVFSNTPDGMPHLSLFFLLPHKPTHNSSKNRNCPS